MRDLKSVAILIIVFVAIIIIGLMVDKIAYTNTTSTCAKITKRAYATGGVSVIYTFEIDGKKIKSGSSNSLLKDISIDSLKNIECVKIEYSNYSTFFNRITDKRILKE